MYNHILISTDGSEVATKGLDHGLALAKTLGAKVTVITVTEALPVYAGLSGEAWTVGTEAVARYEADRKAFADDVLGAAKNAADRIGVAVETLHVPNARPAEAIVDAARTRGCSLITMSSHGRRGIGRLLLGSQTSEVLTHSPVPVLVVR